MNFRGVQCSEISAGAGGVRAYIGAELSKLLATRGFLDALPGCLLPNQRASLACPCCSRD